MKTVILLRHAKSSWSDPALADHDRPLNDRGRGAAPAMGEWLLRRDLVPDLVVCSSAVRARETVERMAAAVPGLPKPVIEPRLYHAEPGAMLDILREQPDGFGRVMFVGHQPGLSAFARVLAGGRIRPGCSRAFEHFPTAGVAVLTAELDAWGAFAPHCATFREFAKPREVMDSALLGAGAGR